MLSGAAVGSRPSASPSDACDIGLDLGDGPWVQRLFGMKQHSLPVQEGLTEVAEKLSLSIQLG